VIERVQADVATPPRPLTDREWQVFDLVTGPRGSRKAAAAALGISESTVDGHLHSVFAKLGVETIGGAARKLGQAERHGGKARGGKARVAASG
jgi:DNA-binding NarL/FixJ family response regulator